MADHPKIENTPGLTWRSHRTGWEARWRARTDLVERGYSGTPVRLWIGREPSDLDRAWISDRCVALQTEMLNWGNGGLAPVSSYNGTLAALIKCYQTDPDSKYRSLRYRTRMNYDSLLKRVSDEHGAMSVSDIKARTLLRWHEDWTGGGPKVAAGHAMVGIFRTLCGFGATILEDEECERLCGVLHKMRFKMARPRQVFISAEQVIAVRDWAHRMGLHSIALAQAIQFELMLRQKDVIGEWVPIEEPGTSDILDGNLKWLRGIRWSEIDENLMLTHVTSKRLKELKVNLRLAPMVVEELQLLANSMYRWRTFSFQEIRDGAGSDLPMQPLTRAQLPASGPIIVSEYNAHPWIAVEFRRRWRQVAKAAGVPDAVYNMDSRSGGITEATNAGANLEDVRHAATHSNIATTQGYSRGAEEKTAKVMQLRAASRNKK